MNFSILLQPFIVNALIAGFFVAITAGVLGYFVILRRYTFASHALSHIGIPGATGAVLIGVSPILGMGAFCLVGGLVIACLGKRAEGREIATGTILAFALGVGFYFSTLSSRASKTLQSVLFGSIMGVSTQQIVIFASFAVLIVLIMLFIYRPLLFSSISAELAKTKKVNENKLNFIFILLLSVATVMAAQFVGSLLLSALIITPAASAINLTANPKKTVALSVLFACFSTFSGTVVGALFNLPISFTVVLITVGIWAISLVLKKR